MIQDELSLVLTVDREHMDELLVSVQTWREFRPLLLALPTHVIYDSEQLSRPENLRNWFPLAEFHSWPPKVISYPDQRSKMLSAWVHVPSRVVSTKWWMKCDANVLVNDVRDWLNPVHFAPFDDGVEPRVVAPSWSYTKLAYGSPAAFDAWADDVDALRDKPPLAIEIEPGAKRAYHRRFNSFVSFMRTDWSKWAAELAKPYGWLPVPSHDGYLSFVALRNGDRWRHYPAKRELGFEKHKRIDNLKARAREIIAKKF